jgi:2-keto-3-deoxy-L-rhamnonate aldolase RhmA
MLAGHTLCGTFVKMADVTVIEVLAQSGLDFLCIDGEHAGWGRDRLDACLAVARALDMPTLMRVPAGSPDHILMALDAGAVGVVVPHVDSVAKARSIAQAAHFGRGGRGFAGSTRWAGFATRTMADVLAQDQQTIVIAQIEEPEGVDAAAGIAAVPGIDGLFAGPADLTVGYGLTALGTPELMEALAKIGEAAKGAGKAYVTWVPDAKTARDWACHGMTTFVVGSDQTFMRAGAAAAAREVAG